MLEEEKPLVVGPSSIMVSTLFESLEQLADMYEGTWLRGDSKDYDHWAEIVGSSDGAGKDFFLISARRKPITMPRRLPKSTATMDPFPQSHLLQQDATSHSESPSKLFVRGLVFNKRLMSMMDRHWD